MRLADRVSPWLAPWSLRRTWFAWALSRAACVALVAYPHLLGAQQDVLGDVHLYEVWGRGLVHGGGLPVGDSRWQYPPAAAMILASPALLTAVWGLPYLAGLVVLLLTVDAALLAGIRRWRGPAAGRFWVLGVLALGPVVFARFDLVAAAFVVAGLAALARRRVGLAGLAFGLGGLVKVWPVLLVVPAVAYLLETVPPGPPGAEEVRPPSARAVRPIARLGAGLLAACGLVAAGLLAAGWWRGVGAFLKAQSSRGLQLEAVPAAPYVVAHLLGLGRAPTYTYGSLQFSADGAQSIAGAATVVEAVIVAGCAALWWPRAARAAGRPEAPTPDPRPGEHPGEIDPVDRLIDRSLLLLLLVVVTSRVFSPQYLVWLLALAAVRGPGRRPDDRWRAGALLLAVALLAQVIYPIRYNDVVQGRVVAGLLLVARDLLELTVCGYAWRAARLPVRPDRTAASGPPVPGPPRPPRSEPAPRPVPPRGCAGDVPAEPR